MEWHEATKEYKKLNEELVSGLSRLIDDRFIKRIVDISRSQDRTTIENQRNQIQDFRNLIENIYPIYELFPNLTILHLDINNISDIKA